ncbi:hypothetical protein H097_04584 [Pseudomonas sp. FH4]|nr:hypothetical protein H097_04584 [Pseudomonas sp. FH4]
MAHAEGWVALLIAVIKVQKPGATQNTVGASLLAMVVNGDVVYLTPRGVLPGAIAGKPAPK